MKITNARLKNLQYFLWIKRLFTVHYYSLLYYYLLVVTCFSLCSVYPEFKCLEKPKSIILMFGISLFGKATTENSNVWKS